MVSGQVLGGRYVLESVIGRGATGRVWRAIDRQSGAVVAVKVLAEELMSDPVVVERFTRERQLLEGLSHPNLVPIRDVVTGDDLAIVMDLIDGGDLRRRLGVEPTLAVGQVTQMAEQIFGALAVVHAAGIAHRDMKPENVLLQSERSLLPVLVTDFGIARAADSPTLTRLTGIVGTPDYIAPELADERAAGLDHGTPAVDVYSTGIILYEALFGTAPFSGGHPLTVLKRHLSEPPFRPDGTPDELWQWLSALLAKDPSDRPSARDAGLTARYLTGVVGHQRFVPIDPAMLDERRRATAAAPARLQTVTTRRPAGPAYTARPESPGHATFRKRRILAGSITAIALVIIGAGVARLGTSPASSSRTIAHAFTPESFANGVVQTRTWELRGKRGTELHGVVTLTNTSHAPTSLSYFEVIPKGVAATAGRIKFAPRPAVIVQDDPVARFEIRDLGPGQQTNIEYDVTLASGPRTAARLASLASQQVAADTAFTRPDRATATLQLATLTLSPPTISMTIGDDRQLSLAGTMTDGSAASQPVLDGVLWTSTNPSVVTVARGRAAALRPGQATLKAQAGALSGSSLVSVIAKGGAVQAAGGVQAHPAPGGGGAVPAGQASSGGASSSLSTTTALANGGGAPAPTTAVPTLTVTSPSTSASTSTTVPPNRTATKSFYLDVPNSQSTNRDVTWAAQSFVAQSPRITQVWVLMGLLEGQAPGEISSSDHALVQLCSDLNCSSVLGQGTPAIRSYGWTVADLGDISVAPGTLYYFRWKRTTGATFVNYFYWTGGQSGVYPAGDRYPAGQGFDGSGESMDIAGAVYGY